MPTINLSFQVIPKVSDSETYKVVDSAIDVVKKSGMKYIVGPMETTMEGELDELLDVVKRTQKVCIDEGAERVMTIIKIDYHPKGVTMEEKIGKYRG